MTPISTSDRQPPGDVLDNRLLVLEGTAEIEDCKPARRNLRRARSRRRRIPPPRRFLDGEHKPRHPARVLFVQRAVESQLPAQVRPGSLQLVPLVCRQPLSAGGPPEEEVHRVSRGQVHDQKRDDGDPDERRDRQQIRRWIVYWIIAPRSSTRIPEQLRTWSAHKDRFRESHSSRAAADS